MIPIYGVAKEEFGFSYVVGYSCFCLHERIELLTDLKLTMKGVLLFFDEYVSFLWIVYTCFTF